MFFFEFTLIGLVQSLCFPAYVSIVANWFPKNYRGTAVTGFCTCVNFGNIIGVQLAAAILDITDDKWQWLFVLLAVQFALLALVQAIWLVPHPANVGIIVEEAVIEEVFDSHLERAAIVQEEFE